MFTTFACLRRSPYLTRSTTTTTTTNASSSLRRCFFFYTQHSTIIMSEENQPQSQQKQQQRQTSSSSSCSSSSHNNGRTNNNKRWRKNKQKGGGRGKRNNNNNNNIQHPNSNSNSNSQRPTSYRPPQRPKLQVYTGRDDFYKMHMKCQQDMGLSFLGKYRVHKPQCNCPKLLNIRKRITEEGNYVVFNNNNNVDKGEEDNNSNKNQEGEEGDDEHVVEKETSCVEIIDSLASLDGLIVHPDVKSIQCIYFCPKSSLETYESNPLGIEFNLQRTMFSSFLESSSSCSSNDIKINGAACLLENEPNGFACVISTDEGIVNLVRDVTRKHIQYKKSNPNINLYSDHGDFILKLPQTLLFQLKHIMKKHQSPNRQRQIRDEILSHMSNQGICIHSEQKQDGGKIEIKIGHHLDSLLHLIFLSSKDQKKKKNKQDESNDGEYDDKEEEEEEEELYWLVYGYDETTERKVSFEINIPGGKRHLGETCLEAAIRETEEEISLVWNERWITSQYQNHQNLSSKMNRYFVLCPPDPGVLMAELEEKEQE